MRLAGLGLAALVLTTPADATSIERVTLPQMERSATVVFVGRAVAHRPLRVGASLGGVRYRFEAVRFLRGGPTRVVHLTFPELPGLSTGVVLGRRQLVFAEPRRFGAARERRLTASGYPQGVYLRVAAGRFANGANGAVRLDRLARRLRTG